MPISFHILCVSLQLIYKCILTAFIFQAQSQISLILTVNSNLSNSSSSEQLSNAVIGLKPTGEETLWPWRSTRLDLNIDYLGRTANSPLAYSLFSCWGLIAAAWTKFFFSKLWQNCCGQRKWRNQIVLLENKTWKCNVDIFCLVPECSCHQGNSRSGSQRPILTGKDISMPHWCHETREEVRGKNWHFCSLCVCMCVCVCVCV